ncbi:MAG: hypothetical protein K8R56_03115 [Candidatus Eisenbacteria bacterium]|nr:hypothetical protein [Candidatus Eisenbacteria bacterium]
MLAVLCFVASAVPVRAGMDIANDGPVLDAGRFGMRITNIGVLGNAFFNKGLSFDPSFEFPKGSGQECLEHAELWVSARRTDGTVSVSGGPMFEWRPTLADADVVRRRYAGERGTRATFDDDGDGKVDEEFLDGRDDDGDGEVDEDVRFPAQETAACVFTDDQREAIDFAYEGGERHVPLGLTVRQEAHTWSITGYDNVAGIQYTLTNHTQQTLRDVWMGVYANLDSRTRRDGSGHLNDLVALVRDSLAVFEGRSSLASNVMQKDCFSVFNQTVPAVHDGVESSGLPWTSIVGLSHTTDPLGFLVNEAFPGVRAAREAARAPSRDTTFRYSVFSLGLPPGQGGPPLLDADRARALRGEFPGARTDRGQDYTVLVSCGPFAHLDPGQSVQFAVALVAADGRDSLTVALQNAHLAYRGTSLDRVPDASQPYSATDGRGGVAGHELCYSPPEGVTFNYDPHCITKFYRDPAYYPPISPPFPPGFLPPGGSFEITYTPGMTCVWSDLDCDACTGLAGRETAVPWFVRAPSPPQPATRVTGGDRKAIVEWDDLAEIQISAGILPGAPYQFWGYRVYRLDDWDRESLLPATSRWQQVASFGVDTTLGAQPLSRILQSAVDYDSVVYERRHHPVGRYRFEDTRVLDGFDYHYVVTTVAYRSTTITGSVRTELLESPFRTVFSDVVRPRIQSGTTERSGRVWVVPNPYRARAPWDREPVPGDAITRHLDFFGLPAERSTIRIYTLAGDLVQTLEHDGSRGDGQAAWNLVSRNGQEVESGVYLFTVEAARAGHQTGRFVVIR